MHRLHDNEFLPKEHGEPLKQPYFPGPGNLTITELEDLCANFQRYCHQQNIIRGEIEKSLPSDVALIPVQK